jgi:hypothetical protein
MCSRRINLRLDTYSQKNALKALKVPFLRAGSRFSLDHGAWLENLARQNIALHVEPTSAGDERDDRSA